MPHIMIAHSKFYTDVSALQTEAVKAVFDPAGVTYETFDVPGSLEIPMAIKMASHRKDGQAFDGYLALGCVIRGDTTHDEHVINESFRGISRLGLEDGLMITNGILTCLTREQAVIRADKDQKDRSGEAARALLKMLDLKRTLLGA